MINTAYLAISEANTYFAGRLATSPWDTSTEPDKEASLIQSTRLIDNLNFIGDKSDEDQELQFPRNDDTDVPDDIKEACAECALALLDGFDIEFEFDNLRMTNQGYGNVRSTHDSKRLPRHIIAGIPSVAAWRKLKPYIRDGSSITLSRTS